MMNEMTPTDSMNVDRIVRGIDYIVSDLHINHKNIIKYCRYDYFEFSQAGLDDMNWELIANWNETVSPGDKVLFVGDFSWLRDNTSENQKKIDNLLKILNGKIVFLRGDHDHVKPKSINNWDYSAIAWHKGRKYLVTHFPGDTPNSFPGEGMPQEFERRFPSDFANRWDSWQIHGHHHNNWLDRYPLVNPDRQTINCSVELTEYRPLAMDNVHRLVEEQEKVGCLLDGEE